MEMLCDSLDLDLKKMFPDKEIIDSYEHRMSYDPKETTKDQLLLSDFSAQETMRINKTDRNKIEKLESHLVKTYYEELQK